MHAKRGGFNAFHGLGERENCFLGRGRAVLTGKLQGLDSRLEYGSPVRVENVFPDTNLPGQVGTGSQRPRIHRRCLLQEQMLLHKHGVQPHERSRLQTAQKGSLLHQNPYLVLGPRGQVAFQPCGGCLHPIGDFSSHSLDMLLGQSHGRDEAAQIKYIACQEASLRPTPYLLGRFLQTLMDCITQLAASDQFIDHGFVVAEFAVAVGNMYRYRG